MIPFVKSPLPATRVLASGPDQAGAAAGSKRAGTKLVRTSFRSVTPG